MFPEEFAAEDDNPLDAEIHSRPSKAKADQVGNLNLEGGTSKSAKVCLSL